MPAAAEPRPATQPHHPCPCGRAHALTDCCLPVARRLRAGSTGATPSPFDEIRASTALLLWGLLARERQRGILAPLAAAARRFWSLAASAVPTMPASSPSLWSAPDSGYGASLFERTWGPSDPETLTWMLSTLPSPLRLDPLAGELALDWLLWDAPWLRDRTAASWLLSSSFHLRPARVRRACVGILRSRLGVWQLCEAIPRRGLIVDDRITGARALLHTPSDPWPEESRLLIARIHRFGKWNLVAGNGLLVEPEIAEHLLSALEHRSRCEHAPPPDDPRWCGWVKATMAPLVAGSCARVRLAAPQLGNIGSRD